LALDVYALADGGMAVQVVVTALAVQDETQCLQ
jgi:hypothetical protein